MDARLGGTGGTCAEDRASRSRAPIACHRPLARAVRPRRSRRGTRERELTRRRPPLSPAAVCELPSLLHSSGARVALGGPNGALARLLRVAAPMPRAVEPGENSRSAGAAGPRLRRPTVMIMI